jgi:hypothetical protein
LKHKITLCLLSGILLFILAVRITAQDYNFELPATDTTYEPKIKTILLFGSSPEATLPIMTLAKDDYLTMQFDLLDGRPVELYYSLFHFDQNWTPNDLRPEEYVNGFQETQITQYATSRKTLIPYVHYQFTLTSDLFIVSGNYLACISDRNKNVLFTKRFYVSANNILVSTKFKDPTNASLYRSHQALEVTINTNKKMIANNGKELSMHIFQNGDPNTLQIKTNPNSYVGDLFYFNKIDDILFKAMKEYRHKDIRTLVSTTQDIVYWDEKKDNYHCWLIADDLRVYKSYLTDYDINGQFLILNRDIADANLESDYIMAHFTLNSRDVLSDPVYLYGAFSNWKLSPEFEMDYDPSRKAYQGSVLLKMGYYNFMYAVPDKMNIPDTSPIEGDWYETENDYNILVYYRPFGSRYDQLLFAGEFNSNR